MKQYGWLVRVLISLASMSVHAGWQVAAPASAVPGEPFFQAGMQQSKNTFPSSYGARAFPNRYANLGQPAQMYAVSMNGSLKENIERIMSRYHWKVLWKAPYDYNFDGRVTGTSLPNVIDKLLKPFPLQGVMYVSNRTLTIMPRT